MSKGPSLFVRFTIYPLVALVFLAIVSYVVFSAAGYQIKLENGKITTTETGIIIINTKPGEANVYLNGKLYSGKTPKFSFFDLKINRVESGNHNLKISKDGYEVWEDEVEVKPGLVTWVNYVLLTSQNREKDIYEIPGDIKGAVVSFDKERELIYSYDEDEKVYVITEVNTTSKETRRLYEFLSKDESIYSLVSYSHDRERFLLRKKLNNKISYIVYESKEDGKLWNLSTLFALNPDSLVFSPYNHDKLYALKDSNIYELNCDSKTQSAILANNVSSLHYDPKELLYIKEAEENHSLWSLSSSNEKNSIVKALPASERYKISYLDKDEDYLILAADEGDLIIYSNGVNNPTLETISSNVTDYLLSPSEERVSYKKGNDYLVYDIEDKEYYKTISDIKIESISWLYNNSNLIYLEEDGKLNMVNYNGVYNNFLFDIDNTLPVISAPNSQHIFFGTNNNEDLVELNSFSFNL